MAEATAVIDRKPISSFKKWFLEGQVKEVEGPHEKEGQHHTHSWWQVMCFTGVDYFSTLGYQPSIAFVAAAALSPLATLIVALLTLFGALPIYNRVARESPHGEGSISMLEDLLPRWRGKLFVLILLGFVATDFIITITLSAADATAHVVENPFAPHFLRDYRVAVTLVLISILGAIFLKGFKEAIGLAVLMVASYLLLNLALVGIGIFDTHPPAHAFGLERRDVLNSQSKGKPASDDRAVADFVPETRARFVGLRNRRGRHAAGERRSGRRRQKAVRPHSQRAPPPAERGSDHELHAHFQQPGDDHAHPG
jgi:hypothetical protein